MTETHVVPHSFDERSNKDEAVDILDRSVSGLTLPSNDMWHVTQVPGKGLGLVAKTDIAVGTLILTDKPLFVVPSHVHQPDPDVLNVYLDSQVSSLTHEDRQIFFSLSDIKSSSSSTKSPRGIYFTNCFTLGHGPSAPTGLLPLLARANHSCVPNTEFHWNQEEGLEELRATADIKAGEELVDCYLDLTAEGRISRRERWELLRAGYGFECNCQACSLEGEEREEDDMRRREVFQLSQVQSMIGVASVDQLDGLLDQGERWLTRLGEMRYKVVHQLVAAEAVFHLAMVASQLDRAVGVAEKGAWLAMVRYGKDSKQYQQWISRKLNPIAYILG